ncbi:MAG: 4-hydroxy-tetrahydrodipicolinate reductase [Phycisphaerales bacterium]
MSSTTTSIIVHGALGRLGARIVALARRDSTIRISAVVDRALASEHAAERQAETHAKHGVECDSLDRVPRGVEGQVLIDFTSDDGARRAAEFAAERSLALLVGTTALSTMTMDELRASAKKIPILVAPNTSLGVAVLARAASEVARALGIEYDVSIVEAHHNQKKDAPSGTALRLAQAIRESGREVKGDQILSLRGGDVVGEHTIRFAGGGEYIELTHRATTRDVFAHGALRAAKWLAARQPGWYTMEHVLGLA